MPYTANKNQLKPMNKTKINYLKKIKDKCLKYSFLEKLYEGINTEKLKEAGEV